MGPQAHVFNHVPKPIAPHEFRDAVLAVCRPRFPAARYARPQRIALAVSGGVDSMAMAFLFATLLKTYRGIKIADNPTSSVHGIVIDHRLRQGSSVEALQVCQELKKIGIRPIVRQLNWREQKGKGISPNDLPNVESLARILRYRTLGIACRYLQASSLFFAHHRDDQYETVLMRLLAGHGYRGLQGIRGANAIPECYELHGVYKSGLLDDQMRRQPFLNFNPAAREMRMLRWALQDAKEAEPWDQIKSLLGFSGALGNQQQSTSQAVHDQSLRVPYLTPLDSEDGGITIYRPLLEFDKDRLIATCEANNVSWFEDHTNKDPMLTTRNALRYLTKTYELPRALQKPSILALAKRSKTRSRLEEAEAHRMLVRETVIQNFDPNAGTLLVQFPTFFAQPFKHSRWFDKARAEARRPLRRLTAAIAIQKLISFVTPERHLPPLANLENVVDRLFPELCLAAEGSADVGSADAGPDRPPAKTFSIAGVLFDPVLSSGSIKWYLSRAPFPSNQSLPERKLPGYLNYRHGVLRLGNNEQPTRVGHWRNWKTAKIWDGRFWIRVSACVAAKFCLLPFMAAFSKPFRTALPKKERDRFEQILKHYAPGKVRYTLPALYSVEDSGIDDLNPVLTLLALPTLGINVPGLERWVKYEARYKHVDISLLGSTRATRLLEGRLRPCRASRRVRIHKASGKRRIRADKTVVALCDA